MKSRKFKNMKKFFSKAGVSTFAILALGAGCPSCNHFLDIVPDNVFQYEDLFTSRQMAYTALATIYYGVPVDQRDQLPWLMGDECCALGASVDEYRDRLQGASIMRGNQSASKTLISYWTGTNTLLGTPLWVIIRECDQFVQFVDRIPDMSSIEKDDWKAQGKFLKAYYMFMLVKMYGPIIIPENFDEGNLNSDLFQPRSKMEDCFDYIIRLLDEAIPYLKGKRETQFLGQPDQVTAKSIKARVLLQRASPFYNGNAEYFSAFLDHNNEHFFAQTEDREKWKAAADAAKVALDACEQYGFGIYRYTGKPYDYDTTDFRLNPNRMQTLYDLRLRITERWNKEIIWGYMRPTDQIQMSHAVLMRKPAGYAGPAPANDGNGWLQASYQVMERFYTENGLPLDEDRTVNRNELHEIVTTPNEFSPEYTPMQGFMQPATTTINMYLRREPRFYSDLGVTGGYYRSHHERFRATMFYDTPGGQVPSILSYTHSSGIAIQKLVHPEAYNANLRTQMIYPYPIMRVSDLLLMFAEAANEYYGPTQEVYDAINEVRLRAGIPTVEESYTNRDWVTDEAYGKHRSKDGMREIILRERANEFAFEFAHRFWDMQRWKRSVNEFSRPLYGWNISGTTAETFFYHQIIQGRKWSITDCLWPIDNREMEKNARLIQNPGW